MGSPVDLGSLVIGTPWQKAHTEQSHSPYSDKEAGGGQSPKILFKNMPSFLLLGPTSLEHHQPGVKPSAHCLCRTFEDPNLH